MKKPIAKMIPLLARGVAPTAAVASGTGLWWGRGVVGIRFVVDARRRWIPAFCVDGGPIALGFAFPLTTQPPGDVASCALSRSSWRALSALVRSRQLL